MSFVDISFFMFILLFFGVYVFLRGRGRLIFLVLSSYFFYGWWDYRFLTLLALSTGIDYVAALRLSGAQDKRRRRFWLLLSIVSNCCILGFFKYYNFFAASLADLLAVFGFQADAVTLQIVLPVGISFYTFQSLSYTIDVFRRRIEPERDPVTFAGYIAFFPQLVAGPIERPAALLPQLRRLDTPNGRQVKEAAFYLIWGYFIKVFIADNMAPVADHGFDAARSSPEMFIGLLAFALQIYGDFAGYSCIALGLARLLGIELSRNFDHPYLAVNPSDFWRRWHVTLSSWFRDYVYIPLGGSQGGGEKTARNLMVTMLLAGLWHGAAWVFVLWGLYHGVLLLLYHTVKPLMAEWRVSAAVSRVMTFCAVLYGWLIFRSRDAEHLFSLHGRLLSFEAPEGYALERLIVDSIWVVLFYIIVLGMDVLQERQRTDTVLDFESPKDYVIAGFLIFVTVAFGGNPQAFIYFQF